MSERKSKISKIVLIVVAIFFALAIIGKVSEVKEHNAVLVWPQSKLSQMLPTLEQNNGKIETDSESWLDVTVYKVDLEDYQNYVNNCKSMGFDNDYIYTDESYSANNDDDYALDIEYDNSTKEMSISLSETLILDEDETAETSVTNDITTDKTAVNISEKSTNSTTNKNTTKATTKTTTEKKTTKSTTKTTTKKVTTQKPTTVYDSSNETVYITKSGSKYHRDGCRHLKSKKAISKKKAISNGYEPCGTCNPGW